MPPQDDGGGEGAGGGGDPSSAAVRFAQVLGQRGGLARDDGDGVIERNPCKLQGFLSIVSRYRVLFLHLGKLFHEFGLAAVGCVAGDNVVFGCFVGDFLEGDDCGFDISLIPLFQ